MDCHSEAAAVQPVSWTLMFESSVLFCFLYGLKDLGYEYWLLKE